MDAPAHRLAAVLFADLVGYSSLSSTDEAAALSLVQELHQSASGIVRAGGGRVVKFIGDAVFAEFGSTASAVRAALELRSRFGGGGVGDGSQPQLRISIHVGDVLVGPDGDLYGDGINVAARLQHEAEPGQIVVSQDVWRQLRQRREFHFVSLGERRLKNIASPVWLFAVENLAAAGAAAGGGVAAGRPSARRILRVVQVAAAYLAASSVVLLSTAFLAQRLDVASWVLPAAAVLLVVGFLVVLGTAWVQSRPAWERSVGQPSPWALDVPDLLGSVSRRRLPDLTWARALLGGATAFALLFGAAGGYVWVRDTLGGALAPDPLMAAPEPALAILPFGSEEDAEMWREGVPDLLALALDGVRGLRVIDSRVIHAQPLRPGRLDSAQATRVGEAVGARFTATGEIDARAGGVRLAVDVRDVATGRLLGRAEALGDAEGLVPLVDELAARILEADGLPVEPGAAAGVRLADLATSSPLALREYLAGERHLRRSDVPAALAAYERARAADPGFALALFRLALARSWDSLPHVPALDRDAERSLDLSEGLPQRERLLIEGLVHLNRRSGEAIPVLERATTLFPDDPDAWFLLGDALFHFRPRGREGESRAAFQRAVELDPGFGPAYPHLIEDLVAAGDTAAARVHVARYRAEQPRSPMLPGLLWAMMLAGPAETAEADVGADAPVGGTETRRDDYEALAGTVADARARARQAAHPSLAPRLSEADGFWERAHAAAREERFGSAVSALLAAASRYDAVRRDGELLRRVDGDRETLSALREEVRDPAATEEADRLRERAERALRDARYADAAAAMADAVRLLERERAGAGAAAPEPSGSTPDAGDAAEASGPPAAPGPVDVPAGEEAEPQAPEPAAVVDQVLGSLESAIEAEDLSAVRRLWTSISAEEAQGFERLFAAVTNLSVDYEVRSIARSGSRLVVTVSTTYRFFVDRTRDSLEQRTTQEFELERSGDRWLIVASRS